jgi:predicted lipid-binding transport protein (Tim44 family)
MRSTLLATTLFAVALAAAPALAQPKPGVSEAPTSTEPTRPARRAARPAREPTAGQMAARERQRKCGAEWKEAKAANRTGGQKWPQYWSRCNARLKGNQA